MKNKNSEFNIVISGVGGQGLLTMLQILDQAALNEGFDFKSAEVHGLAQRGGAVEVHFRFCPSLSKNQKIYSPLIKQGGANLVISLELQEALKGTYYSSKETIFLVNDFLIPIPGQKTPNVKEVSKILKKFSKKIILVPASNICQKEFGTDVLVGIFLLGYGIFKNLIPLKSNSVLKAIKKIIPEKYLDLNLKAFELTKKYVKKN